MNAATGKAELRAGIRARRRERSPEDRLQAERSLADGALALLPDRPTAVACYLSLPAEPGTDLLIARVRRAGHEVWLPRIAGPVLDWVRVDRDTVYTGGPMGIREPVGSAEDPWTRVSTVLLPGLAVDGHGFRLGQGGGFYDRVLSGLPELARGGPRRVVLLFDDEILDEVPVEPHDCRVDAALTPSGLTTFDA